MKSRKLIFSYFCWAVTMAMVLSADSPVAFAADMKPEDVVARHLDSIGTAEARAATKTRIVQGKLSSRFRWEAAVSCRARARWFPRDGNRSS